MKQEKINVVFVNSKAVEKGEKFKYISIENNLQSFYKLLDCNYIEIPTRKINGKYYDIIVDEEFLLKVEDGAELLPSVALFVSGELNEIFFGNAIICSHNEEGDMIGVNQYEALSIMSSLTSIYNQNNERFDVIKATY